MVRYYLRQLPHNSKDMYKGAKELGDVINIRNYVATYQAEVPENTKPELYNEELFRIFNTDHPEGFAWHSMSVGDIIEYKNFDTRESIYYLCDHFGFTDITNKVRSIYVNDEVDELEELE